MYEDNEREQWFKYIMKECSLLLTEYVNEIQTANFINYEKTLYQVNGKTYNLKEKYIFIKIRHDLTYAKSINNILDDL